MANGKMNMDTKQLVLCFQIHQPKRIKRIGESIGEGEDCFDTALDRQVMEKMSAHCYVPMNNLLLKLIRQYPDLRFTFSISGIALEQMQQYAPEALDSFQELVSTGCVELLSETYYHSLSFLMHGEEFEIQILEHAEKLQELFGYRPRVFRNAGYFYNDQLGKRIHLMGWDGILTEGTDKISKHSCPNCLYQHKENSLKILLRNYRLSDDIAFRVPEWNLQAETFLSWLESMPADENLATISLDYETFGDHNPTASGTTDFLERLLLMVAMQTGVKMATPSEVIDRYAPHSTLSLPDYVSVSGSDLSDWFGNDRQRKAFAALAELEWTARNLNHVEFIRQWRYLQACENFYYMSDAAVDSPYSSPQEAYENFMNVIAAIKNTMQHSPEMINEKLEHERRQQHAPDWALRINSNNVYHP